MGSPPQFDLPVVRIEPGSSSREPVYVMPAPRRPPPSPRRHVILFVLTVATTTFAGMGHYQAFLQEFSGTAPSVSLWALMLGGFWYSASILAILGSHEFGHYFACRLYRVDASLPYFLPVPLPLTGTFGAFIRIRQPIPDKRALFDIGIAGPIAGFVVAVPVLFMGMHLSNVVRIPGTFEGTVLEFGEPLLFQMAAWLTFGTVADGYTVNMHPMVFAAWFGLLATALNLFPMGQLDGGHISYAVLGPKSTLVTAGTVVCLLGLSFVSSSWVAWTLLTVGMLGAFGLRHPRTPDEHVPLDGTRLWLAAFAALMFVLCFTPSPLELRDLVARP